MTDAPAGAITIEPARAWRALAVLLVGISMSLLDATIVNVALPTIRTSLNASESTLSWVISGYSLTFGLALIPAGRIGDRFGHKWVFFSGLALFTAASVACGLAQNDDAADRRPRRAGPRRRHLPARGHRVHPASCSPAGCAARRSRIFGAVIGVSSALGPLVGGLLIQAFGDDERLAATSSA